MFHHLENKSSHLEMQQRDECTTYFSQWEKKHKTKKNESNQRVRVPETPSSHVLWSTEMYFTQCGGELKWMSHDFRGQK